MNKFYNCFTPLNNESNKDSVKIEINHNFKSLIEIFDYFGDVLYKDAPEKNIILGGTYFGKNIDAFFDCLTNYFFEVNEYAIDVYIDSKSVDIPDKYFYIFINTLFAVRRHFPDMQLNVLLSQEIFNFYFDMEDYLIQTYLLEPSPFE